ncbi:TIGR03773 family transporter-associated surface protein [Allonocardiopsis opalescens]|uniref:Putative ABC transporter-associated repeat protein n=1 Tax=Allonocardiopsis opalescens TaxID=1144618 RepID=A0A2T0Q2J9_9ACTN|nr:TIGR03773 family transporter-associated surface protein [Allonocardiopsis opalescens]PRX97950.1 putative ABC transporter-associated repeat protein [Allonocardiopsis opalescens]
MEQIRHRGRRVRRAALGAAAVLAGLALAAAPALGVPEPAGPAPAASAPPAAAVDIALRLDGGDLAIEAHGSAPDGGGAPLTGAAAPAAVPEDPAYAFLGRAGDPVWLLPAGGGTGALAWDTTAIPPGTLDGDAVELRLVDVRGPGAFTAFSPERTVAEPGPSPEPDAAPAAEDASGGPAVVLSSTADAHRAHRLPVAERAPTVWAFDRPGDYQVTLAATGALADGGTAAAEATYDVRIGAQAAPEDEPGPGGAAPDPGDAPAPSAGADPQAAPVRSAPRPAAAQTEAATGGTAQTTSEDTVVLDRGHVDVAALVEGGALSIQVKDGTQGGEIWRPLSDVVFHVRPEAQIEVPDGADFAFLGEPGAASWMLPQTQDSALLWPGWNTEEIGADALDGGVNWTLTGVEGPGDFALFINGSFGAPEVLFDSSDGLPDAFDIPLGTHAHGNWAFSEQGVYRLSFTMSGTLPSGQPTQSEGTLSLAVGDVDPGTVDPGAGGGAGDGGGGDGGQQGDQSAGGAADDGAGGSLPLTGTGIAVGLTALGLVLAVGGAVLLLVVRRRRSTAAHAAGSAPASPNGPAE